MSFYDARFHHTFQCLSLNVKDQNWERDLAEHEVWLPNWRRHQAKAGAVRALGRGSRLRIPRRRASPMLKEQAEVKNVQYSRMINQYFLSLTEMRLWFAKMYPLSCPSGVEINIKKKLPHVICNAICLIFECLWCRIDTKHRKNCECCPGHYVSSSVY